MVASCTSARAVPQAFSWAVVGLLRSITSAWFLTCPDGRVGDFLGVADGDSLGAADAVALGSVVWLADALGSMVGLADALGSMVGLADALGLMVGLADALGSMVGLTEALGATLGLADALGSFDGDAEGVGRAGGVRVGDGVTGGVAPNTGAHTVDSLATAVVSRWVTFSNTAGSMVTPADAFADPDPDAPEPFAVLAACAE